MSNGLLKHVGLGLVFTTALCATASAGWRNDYDLSIDVTHRTATGAFGTVRKNGNSQAFISCSLQSGQNTQSDLYIQCIADNGAGQNLTCTTNSPAPANLVMVAQAMHYDSYISFAGVAGSCQNGCCLTSLASYTGSQMYPLQP